MSIPVWIKTQNVRDSGDWSTIHWSVAEFEVEVDGGARFIHSLPTIIEMTALVRTSEIVGKLCCNFNTNYVLLNAFVEFIRLNDKNK